MKDRLLEHYQRLPGPMRSMIASLRGLQLRSRRYGRKTMLLVEQALERERWSPQQWKTWKEERLDFMLDRAASRVPYYRDHWAERRRRGDNASWNYLENWPILEKETVRENARAFIADDRDARRLFHSHTSGTSGKPLDLWYGKDTARLWYALFEARCRRWYGVSRKHRWAILGGQLIASASQRRPPFWVWNAALNQLYMSSYHLAPDLIPHYLDALRRYRVDYLYGYSSALHELAQHALQTGRDDLKMVVAITNAEPVFDYQREAIERAFQCRVRETYGMAEMVAGASECEAGSMHLWPEASEVEVDRTDLESGNSRSGYLIATGLLNADMPLVRYRIGDRVTLKDEGETCICGRTLSMLEAVEGRADDILRTADGRSIGRLDPVFKAQLPIREAQIIQESFDLIRVRYVPSSEFTSAAGRSIVERLQARMGNVKVILEETEKVPRGANGKFRAVICAIPAEDRQHYAKRFATGVK